MGMATDEIGRLEMRAEIAETRVRELETYLHELTDTCETCSGYPKPGTECPRCGAHGWTGNELRGRVAKLENVLRRILDEKDSIDGTLLREVMDTGRRALAEAGAPGEKEREPEPVDG